MRIFKFALLIIIINEMKWLTHLIKKKHEIKIVVYVCETVEEKNGWHISIWIGKRQLSFVLRNKIIEKKME